MILLKRVLITGANSYVGTNVEKGLMREPDKYYVETLDMKDPNWKSFDFSKFDVVFHVAGIAHIREDKTNKELYYKINRDLALETAKRAKESGVKQFIFMSSMSVYGDKLGTIKNCTEVEPISYYGKSKYEAERLIISIEEHNFLITILRPPMIYGYNCPGNYSKLRKLALLSFVIPKIDNSRKMLFIDNFVTVFIDIITNDRSGIYIPANSYSMNTSHMMEQIRLANDRIFFKSRVLGVILLIFIKSKIYQKMFGNLTIDRCNFVIHANQEVDFIDSIKLSEGM